ncbi:glycosyltransferase family 2 protein [Algoriphagus aestuarii]|nr:glycosyltransferase family 2 protein [Algoriphagus aestuarii]
MKLAVLITCHNRKEKTRTCLSNLFSQELPGNSRIKVFLCDDGSVDGTGEMVQKEFPQVYLIHGTGNLYWNGGMNLAWKRALETDEYDFFFWLNDDTFLIPMAILKMMDYSEELDNKSIISAACAKPGTKEYTYGGHGDPSPVKPNGKLQKLKLINGNFVLVPQMVVKSIGTLSESYTQNLGDFDYGLRAQKAGFTCYLSKEFLGECDYNQGKDWADPKLSLKDRWSIAHSIKGLNMREFIHFKSYHEGKIVGVKSALDTYLKLLAPHQYVLIRNFLRKKVLKRL